MEYLPIFGPYMEYQEGMSSMPCSLVRAGTGPRVSESATKKAAAPEKDTKATKE